MDLIKFNLHSVLFCCIGNVWKVYAGGANFVHCVAFTLNVNWTLSDVQNECVGFLGAVAKLRKTAIGFYMSARPHTTTRLSLDGFS
jgi:hypothetical protein